MIFLSYRSEDEPGYAGRLADSLSRVFGRKAVFQDRDSLPAGSSWIEELDRALAASTILIVIVGKNWGSILRDRRHAAAEENSNDIVRHEILQARRLDTPILVLLINDTRLPDNSILGDLHFLGELHHFNLRDGQQRWNEDIARLSNAVVTLSAQKKRWLHRRSFQATAMASCLVVLAATAYLLLRPAPLPPEHVSHTTLPLGLVAHDWQEGKGLSLVLTPGRSSEDVSRLNNLAFPPGADSRRTLISSFCEDNALCIDCGISPKGSPFEQAQQVSIRLKPDSRLDRIEMLAEDGSNSWPRAGPHELWENIDKATGKRYVFDCTEGV